MTPFTGRAIGLLFAELWLLLGTAVVPLPWRWVAAAVGTLAIAALVARAWRMRERRTGLFRMRRYWIAAAGEVVALAAANAVLHRLRLDGYLLPAVAVIVGVHFTGLWWAGGGAGYLGLAATLTTIGLVALLLPPASAAMQAVVGFGSAAALAGFAGFGARR